MATSPASTLTSITISQSQRQELRPGAASPARVGTRSLALLGRVAGASGRRSDQRRTGQRLAVRCQATSWFTKFKSASKAADGGEDLVGTVQMLKEGVFDVASHVLCELLGKKVKLFLVSTELDQETKDLKLSPEADLLFNTKDSKDVGKDSWITIKFSNVPKDFGKPGALLVESKHENEFYLKSFTIDLPSTSSAIYFPCYSWVNHISHNSNRPRIFFSNQAFLPKLTPMALVKLREEDLALLRGVGTGERKRSERIYDYDVYNDLGSPDSSKDLARPVLGGSSDLPYPRRCRSGRPRCKSDPTAEEPVTFDGGYVPRDERFSPLKMELFLAASIKSFGQEILPVLRDLMDEGHHFRDFDEVHALYDGELRAVKQPKSAFFQKTQNGSLFSFPPPGVVQANRESWATDIEFGRQRLAGLNPFGIELLKELPIMSKLDPKEYGPPTSVITTKTLEPYLMGFSVEEALKQKRLFILDYHDAIMPFVNKINQGDGKIYASRTIFFLTRMGLLQPIAIELCLPPITKGEKGLCQVFTPGLPGLPNWPWRLAKAHVATLDIGIHELISHWLRTHACMEPFIIATHRQLSTMHPLHVLLEPHFKDTMNINAMARTSLIQAQGIIEKGFTPGRYSLQLSSIMYKAWRFDEQALPRDLLKRGMAEEDPSAKHGVKLVLEDYPYAEDGLELWGAIKDWVRDYVGIYYKADEDVEGDKELQGWWKEITEEGHGDHRGAEWWGEMRKVEEVVETVTTIIWLASGHHSAVNFGQYAYAGFMPNCPTMTKRLIPLEGSKEYDEMSADPEKFYLSMVSSQGQTTLMMATAQILATHFSEEEYLGERSDAQWTSDPRALAAFDRFNAALKIVEASVEERNRVSISKRLHRTGPVLLPYTLLAPLSGGDGLTFRGVPNSISI